MDKMLCNKLFEMHIWAIEKKLNLNIFFGKALNQLTVKPQYKLIQRLHSKNWS